MLAASYKKTNHSLLFSKIHLTVNNKQITGNEGESILHLLKKNQIQIPSLCNGNHSCKLCKVLVNNEPKLACSTTIENGMNIITKSESIRHEILQRLSELPKSSIVDNLIQTIKDDKHKPTHIDNTTNSIQVDYSKCIDCGSCAKICGVDFLIKDNHIQPFGGFGLKKAGCMSCGKCAEICPAKAITYTDNIHLYKDAFVGNKYPKVAALDMSIASELEETFNLPKESLKSNDILCLLKNLGFDYFFDTSLMNDVAIINDAIRIKRDRSKGIETTIGTSCFSLLKKILKIEPTLPYQMARVFLNNEKKITTFAVSGCFSLRGLSNVKSDNNEYLSVGISPNEFISIIKEKSRNSTVESLFNGSPCQNLPLASSEGVMVISDEANADFAIRTYFTNFEGKEIQPLQFKKVDRTFEIASFDDSKDNKFKAAVAFRRMGFDKLMKKKMKNLFYVLPVECSSHSLDNDTINRYKKEAETRKIKRSWNNEAAMKIWKSLRENEE